jgi:5'-nucleotidase
LETTVCLISYLSLVAAHVLSILSKSIPDASFSFIFFFPADFDFGVDKLEELQKSCGFPWVLTNVIDGDTGKPLSDGIPSIILEHCRGIRIGIVGLVEREWLVTIEDLPASAIYQDFCDSANVVAKELREKGADVVIALAHMRYVNQQRLAKECPGVDLVLGGHGESFFKNFFVFSSFRAWC